MSAIVHEFLSTLSTEENDFERRKRLQDEVLASVHGFDPRERLTRAELHERR